MASSCLWMLAIVGVASASFTPSSDFRWDDEMEMLDLETPEVETRLVTPYQGVSAARIGDVMVNRLVVGLRRRGEDMVKSMNSLPIEGSQFFQTNNGQRAIRVKIFRATFSNLGSIRRSRRTTLNPTSHTLDGSFRFRDTLVDADYELQIDAIGQAPSNRVSGRAQLRADSSFINYRFLVDADGLPAGISSWRSEVGQSSLLWATNLDNNSYRDVFNAVLENALNSLIPRLHERDLFNFSRNQLVGKMQLG